MRIGLAIIAALFAATLPAQVAVCLGGDGHVEFELADAPCCPDEPDECSDCTDQEGGDLLASRIAGPAPVALASGSVRAPRPVPASRRFLAADLALVPGSPVETVVLRI